MAGLSWENSKENAAPLRRGRSVEHLEQPMMNLREKEETIALFEERIEAANADAQADVLRPWIDYIKWHENHFPSQVHDQFLLLERCFRAFQADQRLFHDSRYIRICCLYADKTKEPKQTFQELYRIGIGRDSATFWNAWAFLAEKSGDFRLADSIFRRAIEERAEPVEFLLRRQKHFQKRMAKHFLEAIDNPNDNDDEEEHHRSLFGSLSTAAGSSRVARAYANPTSTFVDRSIQSSASVSMGVRANNNISRESFAVYGDNNENSDDFFSNNRASTSVVEREPEHHRWKENQGPRERWNDRTHGPSLPAKTCAFTIHVDEQCAKENARQEEERSRKEKEHREARRGLQTTNDDARREVKKAKPAWKKALLKNSAGNEQCFEEARCTARYFQLVDPSTNINLMAHSHDEDDDSSMSICDSCSASILYDETTYGVVSNGQENPSGKESRTDHEDSRSAQPVQGDAQPGTLSTNASWNSDTNSSVRLPTPTINTQFAMNQVSMMFSSPMVGNDVNESMAAPLMHRSGAFEHDVENDPSRPRYPDARTLPEAEPQVLNAMEQEDEGTAGLLNCQGPRRIGSIRQDNPMVGLQEHDMPSNPGFSIYEDVDDDNHAASAFNRRPLGQAAPKQGALSSFTVFQDEAIDGGGATSLSIFRDRTVDPSQDEDSVSSEDMRLFGGAATMDEHTFTGNVLDRLTTATQEIPRCKC